MRSYETDTTENQWARIAFCFTQGSYRNKVVKCIHLP